MEPPPKAERPLRVVILGEDPLARAALRGLLEEVPEVTVDAAAARTEELPPGQPAPRAVVWDLGLRPEEALERAEDALSLDAPLVALIPDEALTRELVDAGILGILPRDADAPTLARALAAVAGGLIVIAPRLWPGDGRVLTRDTAEPLTPREREVLALVAEGLSNRAIAQRLGISEHTAKFHVNQLLQKVGAQTRTEVVVRAARLGWVTL